MKFILSIDTEGDNQWDHGCELTVENLKFIPRFQDLCNKYNVTPTYLVTSEVCEDSFAKEMFCDYLQKGEAEIGAHLHPWTTPPFYDKAGLRYNDVHHAFASELSEDIVNAKIKYLTAQVEESFGERPLSFRSGRFGFDEKVGKALANNGYLIDSSVTPYISWVGQSGIPQGTGGPDFLKKTAFPYTYNFNGVPLIEIPVTILPTKFPLNRSEKIAGKYFKFVEKSISLRIARKFLYKNQPLWLRPFNWMNIALFSELINESINIKLPYLVMMFHSSELMPGCSNYRNNSESVEKLYDIIESFFILLKQKNISSTTLTGAAKSYKNENLLVG